MNENDHELARPSRHRSPNYPAVSLVDAVNRVGKLYQADKRAGSPLDAALRHIGFSGRNGKSMMVVSALKKYGLIEEVNGRVAATQRAVEILVLPKDDPRRQSALKAAAMAPEIVRELVEQFKDGLPSAESLKSELIAYRGFNPSAVDRFITDLFVTLEFAGLDQTSEISSELEYLPVRNVLQSEEKIGLLAESNSKSRLNEDADPTPRRGTPYRFALSSEVTAELRIDGAISPEDLETLRDYIETTIKALGRKVKSPVNHEDSGV